MKSHTQKNVRDCLIIFSSYVFFQREQAMESCLAFKISAGLHTRTPFSVSSQHSLPSPPQAAWSRCDTQNAKPFCCNDFGSAGEPHGRKGRRQKRVDQASQSKPGRVNPGRN